MDGYVIDQPLADRTARFAGTLEGDFATLFAYEGDLTGLPVLIAVCPRCGAPLEHGRCGCGWDVHDGPSHWKHKGEAGETSYILSREPNPEYVLWALEGAVHGACLLSDGRLLIECATAAVPAIRTVLHDPGIAVARLLSYVSFPTDRVSV